MMCSVHFFLVTVSTCYDLTLSHFIFDDIKKLFLFLGRMTVVWLNFKRAEFVRNTVQKTEPLRLASEQFGGEGG